MHQVFFLLLPTSHLASGFAVTDCALRPNSSTATTIAHHSEAAKASERVVLENKSSAPNHNVRTFLIIFGAIAGFMCLSVALFFTHALVKKRRYGSGKKEPGGGMVLGGFPGDGGGSADSDIWGLSNNRQSLGAAAAQEKGSGSRREGVIPPKGHAYQEVPTEEAARRYTTPQ